MIAKITRAQELQLIGLQTVAATHIKAMDDLELAHVRHDVGQQERS